MLDNFLFFVKVVGMLCFLCTFVFLMICAVAKDVDEIFDTFSCEEIRDDLF